MTTTTPVEEDGVKRRDFLYIAAGGVGAVGTALAIWPFVDQMNPSADVLALSSTEVDLGAIEEGAEITAVWQGKPVFIRHRTADEISAAESVDVASLPDPQADSDRIVKPEWLIMIGVCTHLGCVPLKESGDFDGWFCPCHGSHYDTSGRIRKGPAPANLAVPPYEFLDDNTVKIG
ncbi:ubiquinol-cytochrome c reductase iron-sulfur subunit [Sneathiella aquimaris]|uniref:ubiquinol-cytochrome c reductase iron-sulfur subunit n=1 Tax=Sneathiella aquimaris TaxID=2599305 RepID=UPI001469C050|nr:ubiquinol-cytochrome c reductase iron-sulfur subunit [Sneathiella aquimaris]